jgi:hypothetical protein
MHSLLCDRSQGHVCEGIQFDAHLSSQQDKYILFADITLLSKHVEQVPSRTETFWEICYLKVLPFSPATRLEDIDIMLYHSFMVLDGRPVNSVDRTLLIIVSFA